MGQSGRPGNETLRVLEALGVPARLAGSLLHVGGRTFLVEERNRVTETGATVVAAQVCAEATAAKADGVLLVADRISMPARGVLNASGVGWLDRRGHLRVREPGLAIDTDVPALLPAPPDRVVGLFTPTGCDVAIALLLTPTERQGTMEVARRTGRSPGRVSELVTAFRSEGLVGGDGRPLIPELFEALAEEWSPRWYRLAAVPPPAPFYRLTGTKGALRHGAPLPATTDWPPES